MKKLSILIITVAFLAISSTVYAANNGTGSQGAAGTQQGTAIPTQKRLQASPSTTGNQVKNQNQVKTQNEGENSQLQVETQEQEDFKEGSESGSQNRNQNAVQNMSEVAAQVQWLLQIRTTGGIGEQVRQVARAQNQAQTQIQEQINKLDSKGKLARIITGTDYGAIKKLEQHLEQNQLRIRQLEQLQNQLTNQEDITAVREAIQALTQENTSLRELINAEEQTGSLFGWLFKLFAK